MRAQGPGERALRGVPAALHAAMIALAHGGRLAQHHEHHEENARAGDAGAAPSRGATAMSDSTARPRSPLEALQTAGATDVGQVRMANQDAFGEFRDDAKRRHMLLVADGMGGHRGGEVASSMTVDIVRDYFADQGGPPGEFIHAALQLANGRVFDRAASDGQLAGMGTTAVAMLFDTTSEAWVAHVGDSRCYRLRDGVMLQLTDDHSVVGELVRRGQLTAEEARVHPQSNEILRAIGTQPDVVVDVQSVDVRPGDRYLLCSDGLSGMVTDDEIAEVLGSQGPEEAVRTLIDKANEAGGTDNITVQIGLVGEFGDHRDAGASPVPPAPRPGAATRPSEKQVQADFGLLPWLVAAAVVALGLVWWLTS